MAYAQRRMCIIMYFVCDTSSILVYPPYIHNSACLYIIASVVDHFTWRMRTNVGISTLWSKISYHRCTKNANLLHKYWNQCNFYNEVWWLQPTFNGYFRLSKFRHHLRIFHKQAVRVATRYAPVGAPAPRAPPSRRNVAVVSPRPIRSHGHRCTCLAR